VGRRKKRKQLLAKKLVRRLPTIFACPNCGKVSLSFEIKRVEGEEMRVAEALCGECGFCARVAVAPIHQAVDAYARLVDLFEANSKRIPELLKSGACLEDPLLAERAGGGSA